MFPTLTVRENLRVAGWLERKNTAELRERTEQVLEQFPVLRSRLDEPATNLSGGQQQMLALGMSFLSRPRMLLIDELSLGLAPVVVEQLLPMIAAIHEQGTTVILVEQSVNLALTIAETAYFMEKGEIRFHGPTEELLARPDILRSVFLEGVGSGGDGSAPAPVAATNGSSPTAPTVADLGRLAGAAIDAEATSAAIDGAAEALIANGVAPPATNGDAAAASASTPPVNGDRPVPAEMPAAMNAPDAGPTEPQGPALEVIDLAVRFGGIQAVGGVSLRAAPGEIIGIIGPNGAGKTTLFDLISGFTRADSGQVLLAGADLTGSSPDRRARAGLGRSFQDARLFPALTVEETISVSLDRWIAVKDPFNAALHLPASFDSEQQVRARVDQLIDLLRLEAFRSKFVHELSTGSRRVVDLACVVAHHPSVVLLDEPSSGIAQREAEALAPLLLRLRDELGATLLVIEHDMPLVTSVADRLVALDQGLVIADGIPEEVLHDPLVVASYLGETAAAIARSGAITN